MNTGAFGENFPYTNFHDLNMDWIIKITKEFLEKYESINTTIDNGLTQLTDHANELQASLDEWYNTHSPLLEQQLRNLLARAQTDFELYANLKAQQTIASIPADYTELSRRVTEVSEGTADIRTFINHLTEIEYGSLNTQDNLKTTLISGYWTTTDNIPVLNPSTAFSHMIIPVEAGAKYRINHTHNVYSFAQFQALGLIMNSNNQLVCSVYDAYGGYPTAEPYDLIIPDGGAYLYLNTDYSADASNVATTVYKFNSIPLNLKLIAGAIRNLGNGWVFIDDANHQPLNLTGVSVNAQGQIRLDYGFTATKVLALTVTPDEEFAYKYNVGASVGLDYSLINVYDKRTQYGGQVRITGNTFVLSFSNFTSAEIMEDGEIRLHHPNIASLQDSEKFLVSANCNNPAYTVRIGSNGNDYVSLYIINSSGEVMTNIDSCNLYVTRTVPTNRINADNITTTSGNFWIFGVMQY